MKVAEETDYTPSWSALLGLEISHNIVVGLEFFDGNSPKGQFYNDHIQMFGIGIHIY